MARGLNVYIVERPDTQSGLSLRADDPTDAIHRAIRRFPRVFHGATVIRARFFAGPIDNQPMWSSATMRITN